ncbi:SUKH-3 domain-containing protein [Tuwongella immobilis]|uniref:SUKH-3 domain-containing protein n=1 Tax=Tuwongella immobilis TaxID=692036 RepID=UPI0013A6E83B
MLIANPTIIEILTASGWSAGRSVDISNWVSQLEDAGYEMNTMSLLVLSSLGGLTIHPDSSDSQVYSPSPIRFDPTLLKWLPRPLPWEYQLGTVLSPLGECYDDSSLLIGNDGRLYANWDSFMECLGENFEDSLCTLLLATKRGTRLKLQQST